MVENARGALYAFHRMSGQADLSLQDAVRQLRDAGQDDLADEIDDVLVGRDVVPGVWTFQLVEAYDEHYWRVFRAVDEEARRRLTGELRTFSRPSSRSLSRAAGHRPISIAD